MRSLLSFIFVFFAATALAGQDTPIRTLDEAGQYLARISGASLRAYSTRDFGRDRFTGARSVIVPADQAQPLLRKLRRALAPGLVAFVGTTRSLAKPMVEGYELVVGEGGNQFAILRIAASDAVNYDKTTEDLITKLQQWDAAYGIDIWQAETDTIQLRLKKMPADLHGFAKEVYAFCPDIIDQGVGSVDALASEIRRTESLFLWWD